jgi:hypothetical protein
MTEPTAPSTEYQRFTTTPLRWYEWLPLPGLLAFAMYLCRGQAEILLRQLQQPDTQSYGLSTIGGGLQNQVSAARAAIRLWKGGGTAHIAAVFVAADSLFTLIGFAAFGALLWTAMRRSLKIAGRYPWPDDRPFRWYRWPLGGAQEQRHRPTSAALDLPGARRAPGHRPPPRVRHQRQRRAHLGGLDLPEAPVGDAGDHAVGPGGRHP